MKTYSIPATYIAGNYQPTNTTVGAPQPITLGTQIMVQPITNVIDVPESQDLKLAPKGDTSAE